MISTGMIFQFNSEQGVGLIMLSDGETKEFGTHFWIDTENEPAVGQKISYEDSYGRIQIKVLNEEINSISSSPKAHSTKNEEVDETKFSNIDDCISYYTDSGFKLVSDTENGESRTINLRLYTPTDYGEATIKKVGSEISVHQILNGKKEQLTII